MATIEDRKQRIYDDWLPIKPSPKTRWWYSTFHNVTAMVGAGVLGLPYAMSKLGWGPGIAMLVVSWLLTLYTLWQMVQMHETKDGRRRFNRYHELGQELLGKKVGLWIVVPQQLIVQVGVDIVYLVTGGQSLMKFWEIILPHRKPLRLPYFILMFGAFPFVISHLIPNFHSISWVSFPAAIMSVSYSTIIWIACILKGKDNSSYKPQGTKTEGSVFGFFSAMGNVAFAFAAHNIVLEIQATIPSNPGRPSSGPMWRGSLVAYIIVAFCYFPVAIFGYWSFGDTVSDDILMSLKSPPWLIAMANLMVAIHLIGSYQIYAMPVFDMIEKVILKKIVHHEISPNNDLESEEVLPNGDNENESNEAEKPLHSFIITLLRKVARVGEDDELKDRPKPPRNFLIYRFIARSLYVVFTVFIAVTFPFFGGLLSFFGGFALAPNSYFLPNIMWLKSKGTPRLKIINWICIMFGVVLMILAATGGLYQITVKAKDYTFYSDYSP